MICGKEELARLIRRMRRKGYEVFLSEQKPCNINIVGIRSNTPVVDRFNDWLVIFWRHEGTFYFGAYPVTTLPGKYYLITKLLNSRGAAILVPGQYRGAYKVGKHRGKYDALVQAGPVRIYRDGDRDNEFDFTPESIDKGLFGINIHRAYKDGKAPRVGRTSAGCQVFQNTKDFEEFMQYCQIARGHWGNSFTYTLLDERNLTDG